MQACAQKNYYVSAVVLDYSGVRQAFLRGDNAGSQNMLTANDKAFTATTFGTDTAEIVKRSQSGRYRPRLPRCRIWSWPAAAW